MMITTSCNNVIIIIIWADKYFGANWNLLIIKWGKNLMVFIFCDEQQQLHNDAMQSKMATE